MYTLSTASKELLQQNLKSSHRYMHHFQTLSRQDLLNPYLWNCDVRICPFFQFGKAHKRTYHKGVIVKNIIKKPGYMIHMDQEVSSIPGRLLTVSSKHPNK